MKQLELADSLNFTAPLGIKDHRQAEEFRKQQKKPQKGKQVYLNTLAVSAVELYLKCMGIKTDVAASDSFDPVMQTLMDVADLEVSNLGKLECRPVLPNQEFVEIPPEVWSDRIGYVAVQMIPSLKEATLLGFVETAQTEKLHLSELRSLEDFREYMSKLKPLVKLSQWMDNIFDAGWQATETLWPQQQQLAFSFRKRQGVERVKQLDLEWAGDRVALLVGMDGEFDAERNILVEVHPSGGQSYLPDNLQLMVLEGGEMLMQVVAKSSKNIQCEFPGEPGESFSVKVGMGSTSVTERFII
ncbi:MAG: DUF1822 family protein [Hormoscilla sp.]